MSNERLVEPQSLGLNPAKVDKLLQRVRREVDEGLLPAAQVALARHGKIGVFESFGEVTATALTPIFSATKAITSAAAWLLFQEGKLAEHEKVAEIIPEFGTNGKQEVTVEQLFTHTAGFPHAPFRPVQWLDKDERYGRFAQWRLTWPAGSRFEYHPSSSMWVIGELIERRSGQSFVDFVKQRVLQPLQLDNLFVGLPRAENERALACAYVGEPLTAQDYADMGMPEPPETEVTEQALLSFNDFAVRAVGVPGGGGYANAADLALFHQALWLGGLDGVELWREDTLRSARRIRTGDLCDPLFNKVANRGLGIIISGDESRSFRGFGKTNSALAFGHNGAGGQLAWVDPATGLSLAYLTPGHDRNGVRQAKRGVAISSLAADCLS